MKKPTPDLRPERILRSKTPFNFFLTAFTISGLFIFFLILLIIGRLDPGQAIFCFLLFTSYIYARFGRYLAKIVLYKDKIEVSYFFPWNRPLTFEFQQLTEIIHQDKPTFSPFSRYRSAETYPWYRSYRSLYLRNEKNEECEIKYNINDSEDADLLTELRK
jgi:hypothetical protein